MIDYRLSDDEKIVLNALQLRESKTTRMLVVETKIYQTSIFDILRILAKKKLAAKVSYEAHPTRWVAL